MKSYLAVLFFFTGFCMASDSCKKHVQQEKYYQKELPYALLDKKQVIIIQNPFADKHVHTIKRSQATIFKLAEEQRLQSARELRK